MYQSAPNKRTVPMYQGQLYKGYKIYHKNQMNLVYHSQMHEMYKMYQLYKMYKMYQMYKT